jgi:hypothetical protein
MPLNSMSRRGALITGSAGLVFACSARPESTSQIAVSKGEWRPGPPLPFAVQEIYPALHAGQIHLAGRFIAEDGSISGATDRHIALSPQTGLWQDLAPLPKPRHHPNLVSFDGNLLAIGGFETQNAEAVWVMQSGTWIFRGSDWVDAPSLPQPNGESVTGVVRNNLHICGGRTPRGEANASWTDHTDIDDHFVLADLASKWETAARCRPPGTVQPVS